MSALVAAAGASPRAPHSAGEGRAALRLRTSSASSSSRGSAMVKVVPCPSTDSTAIRPPWAVTNSLVIYKPRPSPCPERWAPLIKAGEELRQVGGCDPRTGILYLQARFVPHALQAHHNPFARRHIADGIGEEVEQHLLQPPGIAQDHQRLARQLHLDRVAGGRHLCHLDGLFPFGPQHAIMPETRRNNRGRHP